MLKEAEEWQRERQGRRLEDAVRELPLPKDSWVCRVTGGSRVVVKVGTRMLQATQHRKFRRLILLIPLLEALVDLVEIRLLKCSNYIRPK